MAASKFDYEKMSAIQTQLKADGDAICNFVDTIATNATTAVNACYSGEAADQYNSSFKKVATEVNAAIKEIVGKLEEELNQQQADYTAKEQQLASSVVIPTLGN